MNISIRCRIQGAGDGCPAASGRDYELELREESSRVTAILTAKRELILEAAVLETGDTVEADDMLMLNGYQSWTDTREFGLNESLNNIRAKKQLLREIPYLDMYGDSPFYEYNEEILHAWTYSYARRYGSDHAVLYGSLNEEHAYMIIEYDKRDRSVTLRSDVSGRLLKAGESFRAFDYLRLEGDAMDIQRSYMEALGYRAEAPYLRGYSSWYNHYQDISEALVMRALSGINAENFDLFQIDDGYQTHVGDWLSIDSEKFPRGLEPVIDEIHSRGLKAGIWISPLVAETNSLLYKEHPELLMKNTDGTPLIVGNNWSNMAALDIRLPEVKAYIRECLEHYVRLGIDFFKVDFIYAAAFAGGLGEAMTHAEAMRAAVRLIRESIGDRLLLGCGLPLSSAFGLVDYCRIGPDISLDFDDKPPMQNAHRERVTTRLTVRNTIARSALNGYVFRNDPDVFLLRDDNLTLSCEQRRAVLIIGHLMGGINMTSDDVAGYDCEKLALLEEARGLTGACITSIRSEGVHTFIRYINKGKLNEISYNHELGIIEE